MIKYTRKQINLKATLHDKEFVTVDDAEAILEATFNAAVKAGADEVKLMEFLSEKD